MITFSAIACTRQTGYYTRRRHEHAPRTIPLPFRDSRAIGGFITLFTILA
jgi:hypothetical protein